MADPIPKHPDDEAGRKLQHADRGAVLIDATRPQMFWHEIGGECLAYGAKDPLKQPVKREQPRDQNHILRDRKAQVTDQENDE
jgi:hypothetical protein